MKKIFVLTLALVLTFTITVTAFAVEATYPITKRFLSIMDEWEIIYTVKGVDEDGDECVIIGNKGDAGNMYDIVIYFLEDDAGVLFYVWDLISFAEADYNNVLTAVNKVNTDWMYSKSYVEDDLTVTVSLAAKTEESTSGDLVVDMLMSLVDYVDTAYEAVLPYAL